MPGVNSGIGLAMETIGTLKLGFPSAFFEGAKRTVFLTERVAVSLGHFIYDAVRGDANLKSVSGPVGMAKMVGQASEGGFKNVALFVALLSLNLAVINIIPFPALDGGRLFMIIIEAIRRRPFNKTLAQRINIVGFLILIILMLLVAYNDIVKLFN